MAFSGGFLVASSFTHSLTPSFIGILKVFSRYIYGTSFIYISFEVQMFWSFKCLHTSRKYNFRLLLGMFFLDVTHWNVIKFVWNFNVMHQASDGFYFIRKKELKLNQKNNFLAHIERFLVYSFLSPMSYNPIFCQTKHLTEVLNCVKFH